MTFQSSVNDGTIKETIHTAATLLKLFDDYYHEAKRLQKAYASQIKIFVGMETDWIRPSSKGFIQNLLDLYQLDLFIGSVHHVDTIPIDYDRATYLKAGGKAGGTEERLFENYFDQQLDMLDALKPPIVGHFDLIRLLSDDPNASLKQWASVWGKILRNLDFIAAYGGIVELNSAALRKGLKEPYPQRDVCVVRRKQVLNLRDLINQRHRSSSLKEADLHYPMTATGWVKLAQIMADYCNSLTSFPRLP